MSFLGSIFKTILSPLTNWVFSMFYGILIRGPLTILNLEDKAFQYASGAQVDKLLFNTTLVEGKPQLNFFTSDSPLKYFFLLTLAAAGALLAIFIGLSIMHSIAGKPSSIYKKSARAFLSGTLVFALPVMFLSALSIVGSLIATMSGQHKALSGKDVSGYQQVISQPLDSLRKMNQEDFANRNRNITGTYSNEIDPSGGYVKKDYTVQEIYQNLSSDKWEIIGSDQLIDLSQTGQSLFNDIQDKLSSVDGKEINPNFKKDIAYVQTAINNLKPGEKDEDTSDELKVIGQKMSDINQLIRAWQDNAIEILKYEDTTKKVTDLGKRQLAIYNFRILHKNIWGLDDPSKPHEFSTINNLYQYLEVTNRLMDGSLKNPNISLRTIAASISDYHDSPLVVSFYQMVTGNKNDNWDQTFNSLPNGGVMILMGFFIILAAIVILMLSILQAMSRIFSLALLFVVSPAVVVLSPLDDGQRMKGWVKMVIAKMTSIIGVVIILRLFTTLYGTFADQITHSDSFSGSSGWMVARIILSCFAIGGLLAAYRGGQTISSIVGAGYGIQEGLQAGQAMGLLRGMGGGLKMAATGGLSALTLGGLGKNNRAAIAKNARSRMGSVMSNSRNSIAGGAKNLALAGASKMGSSRAGLKLATNKANASKAKAQRVLEKSKQLQDKQKDPYSANPSAKSIAKAKSSRQNAMAKYSSALKNKASAASKVSKKIGKRGK